LSKEPENSTQVHAAFWKKYFILNFLKSEDLEFKETDYDVETKLIVVQILRSLFNHKLRPAVVGSLLIVHEGFHLNFTSMDILFGYLFKKPTEDTNLNFALKREVLHLLLRICDTKPRVVLLREEDENDESSLPVPVDKETKIYQILPKLSTLIDELGYANEGHLPFVELCLILIAKCIPAIKEITGKHHVEQFTQIKDTVFQYLKIVFDPAISSGNERFTASEFPVLRKEHVLLLEEALGCKMSRQDDPRSSTSVLEDSQLNDGTSANPICL